MVLPEYIVWYLLTFAGFSFAEAHVMTCVAKYESSFRTNAENTNKNGSKDYGLFQINTIWHKNDKCKVAYLYNPVYNTLCARHIYEVQGINAWYGYKNNKETCDGYKVNF